VSRSIVTRHDRRHGGVRRATGKEEVLPLVLGPIVGRTAHGHVLDGLVFGALQASQQRVDELVVLALAEVFSEQVGEQASFFQRELAPHKP
jgi:hypothetical protein